MLYVGLTEDHRESASMFANVVGSQIISQLVTSSSKPGVSHNKSGQCLKQEFYGYNMCAYLLFLYKMT